VIHASVCLMSYLPFSCCLNFTLEWFWTKWHVNWIIWVIYSWWEYFSFLSLLYVDCRENRQKNESSVRHIHVYMYVWRVISTLFSCSTLPWFRVTASARYTANPTTPVNCIKQPVNISILSCVVRFCHFLFTYHICTKNVTKAAKPDKNKEKQMIY
jgi:hypothetical protein